MSAPQYKNSPLFPQLGNPQPLDSTPIDPNRLLQIVFHNQSVLSALDNRPVAAPINLYHEVLAAIRCIPTNRAQQSVAAATAEANRKSIDLMNKQMLKVGEPFAIEFYFIGKYLYFEEQSESFILSEDKQSVFKIIIQTNNYSKDNRLNSPKLDPISKLGIDSITQCPICSKTLGIRL